MKTVVVFFDSLGLRVSSRVFTGFSSGFQGCFQKTSAPLSFLLRVKMQTNLQAMRRVCRVYF